MQLMAIFTSLVFLIAIVVAANDQPVQTSLQKYLSMSCQRERMTVKLNFGQGRHPEMSKDESDMIWRGRICIGDVQNTECCSRTNMIEKNHVLTVGYSKCGIKKTLFEAGFDFIAEVRFRRDRKEYLGSHMKSLLGDDVLTVRCAVPFMESHVKAKMVLLKEELNLSKLSFANLPSEFKEPLNIRMNSRLFIAIEPTIEGMQKRLHTYPLQCWTSASLDQTEDFHVDNERRYFIKNGCPVVGNLNELASIYQNAGSGRFADWTKITVTASTDTIPLRLLNRSKNFELREYGPVFIHCDVMICTGDELSGFQSVSMCPRSTFCLTGKSRLPAWVEAYASSAVRVVSFAAVNIFPVGSSMFFEDEKLTTKSTMTSSPARQGRDCSSECAAAIEGVLVGTREDDCRSTDGIPIYVVVVIAVISFGFGVVFVAVLWTIHIRTDPLRKIRCIEHSNSTTVGGERYLDPTVRSGNAFMTTTLVERERLVHNRT